MPTWTSWVILEGQARAAEYNIQSVLGGADVLGAVDCAVAHADIGEVGNQLWNGSTTSAEDTSDPVCRTLAGGEADSHINISVTSRGLDYDPPEFLIAGHMTGLMAGPSYGLWFTPPRYNLNPWGTLFGFSLDPVDYGYPEDAELEWEGGEGPPDLLGIWLADGDPVTSGDTEAAPYKNRWGLNYGMFGHWQEDGSIGSSTPWTLGPFPDEVPDPVADPRPEMLWDYTTGVEGEGGVEADDIWHPLPDSAGWDGHGWLEGPPPVAHHHQ